MRTTLNIDDDLFKAAKIEAIERNCSLTRVIEAGLRKELTASQRAKRARAMGLPADVDAADATAVSNFWKHAGDDRWLQRALGPLPSRKGNPRKEFDWTDTSALIEELEGPFARS